MKERCWGHNNVNAIFGQITENQKEKDFDGVCEKTLSLKKISITKKILVKLRKFKIKAKSARNLYGKRLNGKLVNETFNNTEEHYKYIKARSIEQALKVWKGKCNGMGIPLNNVYDMLRR